MLPDTDGVELMKQIHTAADVPVVFLSAYGQDHTITRALQAGAEDYIVKPFSPTELAARVQTVLRRQETSKPEPAEPYTHQGLTINYPQHTVTLNGEPVQLTATEYRILHVLSVNAGHVVTHKQLQHQIWGYRQTRDTRALRTHLTRLRRKLQDNADNPAYIFAHPRVGYRMPKPEPPG